ncbi:P-loop NTPase [Elusimicrobiota bacterium]
MAGFGRGGDAVIDPRLSVLDERLSGIGRVVLITGGKGGVGKSVLSSCLALASSRSGRKVGLLDLDLTSPSQHVILGAKGAFPTEDGGLVPPSVHGMMLMSMSFFVGDKPAPLRGADISNAMIELLAVTIWGELDLLVVDMPPGLSDAALDAARLLKGSESVLVTTPSRVSFSSVEKTIRLFKESGARMIGVLENMRMKDASFVKDEATRLGVPYLGAVRFDPELEDAIGSPERLLASGVVGDLGPVVGLLGKGTGAISYHGQ